MCAWYSWRPEKGIGFPELELQGIGCKLRMDIGNPDICLQEQEVILTRSHLFSPGNSVFYYQYSNVFILKFYSLKVNS